VGGRQAAGEEGCAHDVDDATRTGRQDGPAAVARSAG
jgi:hypothetical protein